jgi:hypothetical protein
MQVHDLSAGHVHQWKRLPIVSLSVTYMCTCTEAKAVLAFASSQNLGALDAEFVKHHGGEFAGEMYPPLAPVTGGGR